jgi:hypothetical protein
VQSGHQISMIGPGRQGSSLFLSSLLQPFDLMTDEGEGSALLCM